MSTARIDLCAIMNPYPKQARFIGSDAFFNMWCGGVGSGKTHALVGWVLRRALKNPGTVGALLGRTGRDLQLMTDEKLFPMVEQIREETGIQLIRDYNRGDARIRLLNDTLIYLRPFNRASKLRGPTWTFAGCDESDHSEADPDELWSVLTGRLRGHGPCPGIAFCTSPNGMRGTVKKFFDAQNAYRKALAGGDLDGIRQWSQYHTVTATSFDNPHNPPHFFDSLRSMSRRRYDQEALGKVLKPLNTVLQLDAHHQIDWDWRSHKDLLWILCVDWGGQNHHAALMIQVDRANNCYVVADELVGDDMPRGKYMKLLLDWVESKGRPPTVAGVDRAAPGENTILQGKLRHTTIQWMHSREQQKVKNGLEHVRDLMDPQEGPPKLKFSNRLAQQTTGPTAPILPAMRNYCYILDAQKVPTDIPDKDNVHDHMIDALRYGLVVAKGTSEVRL